MAGIFDLASNLGDSFCSLSLASALAAGATGAVTVTETNGYSMANMANKGFLVIDPGTSSKEKIYYSARDTSAKTVTITTRGVGESNDIAHSASAAIINAPIFEYLEQILNGPSTFTNPIVSGITTNNSRARAYLNANQTGIVTSTTTKLLLDTETTDVGGNFSTVTSLYTVPTTGLYLVIGACTYLNTLVVANKRYDVSITKNGAVTAVSENITHSALATYVTAFTMNVVSLTATDTLQLNSYHEAGVNQTAYGSANLTFLSVLPL